MDAITNTWINPAYGWGYADNLGTDAGNKTNEEAGGNPNFFRIENAIHANGEPVNLQYIDFIKVQTAIQANAGILGEVFTEVLGFEDLNIQ
ncbi:MAG: hypothetical protein LIP01_07825 [Tannerellaceae bacterium]|nr:hypothetical protein [Tannerellaceae bacterium]